MEGTVEGAVEAGRVVEHARLGHAEVPASAVTRVAWSRCPLGWPVPVAAWAGARRVALTDEESERWADVLACVVSPEKRSGVISVTGVQAVTRAEA